MDKKCKAKASISILMLQINLSFTDRCLIEYIDSINPFYDRSAFMKIVVVKMPKFFGKIIRLVFGMG